MTPIKCTSINQLNPIPIFVSVGESPEITRIFRTKEKGKTVEEQEITIRPAGVELKISKAGTDISIFLTKEQAEAFLNPSILQ